MLILSRFLNQIVDVEFAGINIEIRVIELRDGQVRLGFRGPREAKILRREVRNAIRRQARKAAENPETAAT